MASMRFVPIALDALYLTAPRTVVAHGRLFTIAQFR